MSVSGQLGLYLCNQGRSNSALSPGVKGPYQVFCVYRVILVYRYYMTFGETASLNYLTVKVYVFM